MSTMLNSESIESTFPEKTTAANLIQSFNQYADKIKVLSLDCFDTLLWRKVATPIDVFYQLQHKPTFHSLGLSAGNRIKSEFNARNSNFWLKNTSEVDLHDIYRAAFPQLTDDQLNLLAEEELTAEIEACYAFPIAVELIRIARAKDIKVIIVSDIYLRENQLKHLLQSCLPQDVMSSIQTIFTSCEYNVSKSTGLFTHVLKKIDVAPNKILHIGDNFEADYKGAKKHKIHALHLTLESNLTELLRMQAASAAIFEPSVRHQRSLSSPFKSILASTNLTSDKPEELIGYASLGQIMYAFGRFLCDEVEELKRTGKKPKVLFLMRDAYLPYLVCEALAGQPLGKCIRISRFAAYAATFCRKEDVDNYVSGSIDSGRLEDIARQLLLPEKITKSLIKSAMQVKDDPEKEFVKLIHQEKILQIIFKESAAYRNRLKRHLEKEANLKPGDTLVFVDLGYSGTAQRQLEPILSKEMGIEITGRYLLALGIPGWEKSRRGLMDPSWCDERTLYTLVTYIALLEQICTSNDPSIIDYDEEGNAIYSGTGLSQHQHNKLAPLQAACLRFVRDADHFFQNFGTKISPSEIREAAMSELGRLLFLPTEAEINYLEDFEFDLNMGTKDTFRVFDQNQGLSSLRKRGLFFTFMEKTSNSFRTNSPAEMRSAGLELTLALMTHHRFSLDFSLKDINLRREKVNIIIAHGKQSIQSTIEAMSTYGDYFSMWIPVGNANLQIGILFGQKYRWVQFESVELVEMSAFLKPVEPMYSEDCWSSMIFNEMEHHGDKLYECKSNASFMMMAPQNKTNDKNYILRVVFRPTVRR